MTNVLQKQSCTIHTYVYMLVVHSSFTSASIPIDIGPIYLSKFLFTYCWDASDQILCDLYIYCYDYILLLRDTCDILRRWDLDLWRNCRKEGDVNIFWQQERAYESFIIWCIAHQMHYVILSLSQSHVNDLSSTIISNNLYSKQHIYYLTFNNNAT